MRQSRWTCNPQNLPVKNNWNRVTQIKRNGTIFGGCRLIYGLHNKIKDQSDSAIYTKKNRNLIESGSGKAHRKISKAFEPSISKNVLPMSLHVLRSHPVLSFFVGKILICINTYNHKLHKICLQNKKNWIKLLGPAEELSLQKCYFNYILVTFLE